MLGIYLAPVRNKKKHILCVLLWNVKCTIDINLFRCTYIKPLSGIPFTYPILFDDFFFFSYCLSHFFVWKMIQFSPFHCMTNVCVILLNLHSQVAISHKSVAIHSSLNSDDMLYIFNFHWINFIIQCCNDIRLIRIRRLEHHNENNQFSLPVFPSAWAKKIKIADEYITTAGRKTQ